MFTVKGESPIYLNNTGAGGAVKTIPFTKILPAGSWSVPVFVQCQSISDRQFTVRVSFRY